MRQLSVFVCLPVALLVLPLVSAAENLPQAKEVFTKYLEAASNNDGKQVVECLTSATFAKWDTVIALARTGTESEIREQSVYLQFTILRMREKYGEKLKQIDGRSYMASSFSDGDNSTSVLQKVRKLTQEKSWEVRQSEEGFGTLYFDIDGKWIAAKGLRMLKEDEGWKIDGVDQFTETESKMEATRKKSGMSRADFVDACFEAATRKEAGPFLKTAPFKKTQ